MSDFLNEEQKKEFLMLVKRSGKSQDEAAKIVGVTPTHFSGALPANPRIEKKKKKLNVPAKWLESFKKELELEELRKLKERVNNLTGDKK